MTAYPWLTRGIARLRCSFAVSLIAAFALLCANVAQAQDAAANQNSLESVSVAKGSSGRTVVRFTLKQAPANPPAGFAIASPPRIALDFLDTANNLGATPRAVEDGALRGLNVIQAGNRTRVVFNLNRPQNFETQVEGNTVLVTLIDQTAAAAELQTPQVQRFAEARTSDVQHSIRDIDFRRGKNGEGRIIVDLSDSTTGIDIRQQGSQLIVDFLRTSVPRNLERRLDVGDFGTPVTTVDLLNQGGNARMVIEPKGLWEHSAYQAENKFILEVKAIQEDPNKLTQGTRQGYKGEKLSLNFQNVEVRAVLQVIADFTGLNIITSDTVQGSLTLRLKDIPWDHALDIIMQTKGLDMRKNGNVIWIAPRDELATKEKLELEAKQQISDLEPLRTETFQLNYTKADTLIKVLTDEKQK
ncbi:MAG TPA: AMIN domain-containing protein, partial [Casimicrobiaceae bacterium]|nr:AMIN domain-containing protein [Casimicrobiaceae bacterium]